MAVGKFHAVCRKRTVTTAQCTVVYRPFVCARIPAGLKVAEGMRHRIASQGMEIEELKMKLSESQQRCTSGQEQLDICAAVVQVRTYRVSEPACTSDSPVLIIDSAPVVTSVCRADCHRACNRPCLACARASRAQLTAASTACYLRARSWTRSARPYAICGCRRPRASGRPELPK